MLLATAQFKRRTSRGVTLAEPDRPISVLKPLAGPESGLRANLGSFFDLDYGDFDLLFAARDAADPALAAARSLGASRSAVRWTALAVGEPVCPNAKVHSLAAMTEAAEGDILVISDSDIRVRPSLLRDLAAEFADTRVGAVTCPYRAVAGRSLWSRLEALGMNTEFWGGVLVAQFLAPMDFAVGPTMAVRKTCLQAVGGWRAVEDHLAEDFQLGQLVRQAGYGVRLSRHVVEHRIGSQAFGPNIGHRLRWRRSTRRSRPIGYWGEVFVNPLPWAVLLAVVAKGAPWAWWLLGLCIALRLSAAFAVGRSLLGDRTLASRFWLLPAQDLLSLLTWCGGFFGRTVRWRGDSFRLTRDGRLRLLNG